MKTGIRERWGEVRSLFEAALEVPRAQRQAYLAELTVDPVVRGAVLSLLASEDGATMAPDATLIHATNPAPAPDGELAPGQLLGNYRVKRTLGRGGMGVVYLAEQAQPRRAVAIKLISGQLDAQNLARFQREADLLARLSHPGIAQIIEVASDRSERPFLVMEYVDGQSLSEHARELSREQRLQLLARICDAVDHAHGRGIVHRDLKPSNILIDADGQPKVLDFGIAFFGDVGIESLTATGMVLGTPAYMSPEQALGHAQIDARADIYALGVIGYELLTDRLPLPVSGLTPMQALRMIRQETPAPLSRIDRTLRGDLEIIIGKALSKEPSLRYANAGALADDLRRFLHQEPILARRARLSHRAWLFARRNPGLMALGVTTAASLVIALVVSLWFGLAQAAERRRAVAEAERAEAALAQASATLTALNQVFSAGNPVVAGRRDVSFRDVLTSAASQIANVPPATRARVLFALAEAQSNLGDVIAAAHRLDEVRELALANGDERLYLRASLRRATQLTQHGNPVEAQTFIREILARPSMPDEPLIEAVLHLKLALAGYFRDQWGTSLRAAARAKALWPAASAAVAPEDVLLRNELEAELLVRQTPLLLAQQASAEKLLALAAKMREAHTRLAPQMGPEHPLLAQVNILADALPDQIDNRSDWSARLIADLNARVPELGADHPAILARIEIALWNAVVESNHEQQLLQFAAASARALPKDSRWRARLMVMISNHNWTNAWRLFKTEEITDVVAAQCHPTAPLDTNCLNLQIIIANYKLRGRDDRDQAVELLESLVGPAAQTGDQALIYTVNRELGMALRNTDRHDEAARITDVAMAALLANHELDEALRDREVLNAVFGYRPNHCERVLEHLGPREQRLNSYGYVLKDVLARMLSTCEVRTGVDPAKALARMDRVWNSLGTAAPTSLMHAEMMLGYLEIHDVLGRDDEFARWAETFDDAIRQGLPLDTEIVERFPWVKRARALTGSRRPAKGFQAPPANRG